MRRGGQQGNNLGQLLYAALASSIAGGPHGYSCSQAHALHPTGAGAQTSSFDASVGKSMLGSSGPLQIGGPVPGARPLLESRHFLFLCFFSVCILTPS